MELSDWESSRVKFILKGWVVDYAVDIIHAHDGKDREKVTAIATTNRYDEVVYEYTLGNPVAYPMLTSVKIHSPHVIRAILTMVEETERWR